MLNCWCICLKITPAKDGKPVLIELIDAKTKEHKETLEVNYILIVFLFLISCTQIAVMMSMFLLGYDTCTL